MYSYKTNRNYVHVTPVLDLEFDDMESAVIGPKKRTVSAGPERIPGLRRNHRTDWRGLREQAVAGIVPTPDVRIAHDRRQLFYEIRRSAAAGDVRALRDIGIGEYNSTVRALNRYRNLCVLALDSREKTRR